MARTFGGMLFYNASQIFATSGGSQVTTQSVYTRNALGDVSWNQIASQTVQYQIGLADVKRPFFVFAAQPGQGTVPAATEFQNAFGTAAGGPSNPFSSGLGTLSSQFGTPAFPWGIAIIDAFAIYSVGTNPLSAGSTLGVTRNVFVENVAVAQTAVITATAVTLTTTAAGNICHTFKLAAPTPTVFEANDLSDVLPELIVITPGGGTARVYGIGMHVAVEYS